MSAPPSSSVPLSSVGSGITPPPAARIGGCIEFMTPAAGQPLPLPPHILAHWLEQLSERIASLGGATQVVQPNVLWFGFGGQEPSLALRRALKVVWPILQQPAQFQGQLIPMRMALALERSSEGLTSLQTEEEPDVFRCRAQAQAGQCVMPSALASWLPNGMATEALPNGLIALVPPPSVMPDSSKAAETTPQSSEPSTPERAVSQPPMSDQRVAATSLPPSARVVNPPVVSTPPQVLSQPATPPTIPEVVLQRFSAPLPQEPSSGELHVYADLMGSGSGLSPSLERQVLPSETPDALPTHPYPQSNTAQHPQPQTSPVLPVAELNVHWAASECFATLASPPAPTHRYADCPNALLAAITQGLDIASPQVVSLTGPSGIGKSVWVNHFLLSQLVPNPQEPRLIWFSSQASHGAVDGSQPLSMWLDCLQRAIPVPIEGANRSQVSQWVEQSVAQVFRETATSEARHCLDTLLFASPPPVHSASGALWSELPTPVLLNTLAQFFNQMASQLPVVVVLDDCHRMDVASLNLLAHLINHPGLKQARMSWVLTWEDTSQPAGALADSLQTLRQQSGAGAYTSLVCGPLSSADFQGLIESGPFQGVGQVVSHTVLDRLYEQSGGSLFYVSEAITWLHAQGVFQANEEEQGPLKANPNVDQHRLVLPPDLPSLLAERLRWLTPEQGELLAWCATFGERFSVAGVTQLAIQLGGLSMDAIHEALHGLAAQQWILTDFQQSGQFRHHDLWALLQQSIPDGQDRHQAVAQWLQQSTQEMTTSPALRATHWQQAGQGAMARPLWLSMAAYAHALGSESGTLLALQQALESLRSEAGREPYLTDAQTAEALQLLQALGTVLSNNYPDEAARLLPTVVTYAQHRGEVGPWLDALSQCLVTFDQIGHWQGALETLDQLLASLPPNGDPMLRSVMEGHRLRCLVALGLYQQAEALRRDPALIPLQHAAHQPASPHARLWQRCLLAEGAVAWRRCQPDAVLLLQALQSQTMGDTELTATVLLERIHAQLAMGPYPVCESWLNDALSLIQNSSTSSSPQVSSLVLTRLQGQWGLAAIQYQLAMGHVDKAHPLVMTTLQQAQSARDDGTWIYTNVAAGHIALRQGRLDDAHQVFEAMANHSAERRLAGCALASWRGLTDVLSAQQRWDEALEIVNNALVIAKKPTIGHTLEYYRLTLRQARCHQHLGQLALAGQTLQTLWPPLSATQYMPLMAECAEAIGQLYQVIAASQPEAARRQQQAAKGHEFLTLANNLRQRLSHPSEQV
ncbi:MAG: AAA family ATPase [Vampirovibrionales bacterium]|nr:AAA family ATPase [Vampirovibrionales bacterium]